MRLASPSILWRIVVRLSLTTLVAILLAYSWLWWRYDSTAQVVRSRALLEQALSIGRRVNRHDDGTVIATLPVPMATAYNESGGAHRYAVRERATGRIVAQGGEPVGTPPKVIDDDDDGTYYTHNPDGPGPVMMFGVAVPQQIGGRDYLIQVEESGRDFEELTRALIEDFAEEGGWLGAPFLMAMLLVSLLTIRQSLLPLRHLSQQAAAIGPASADVRLPEAGVPREILPLVSAVNSALDRLETGFRFQREFSADAAHELRTPLAVLRAHIDTLPDAATRQSLGRDVESMTRLIGQLLSVAQVEALTLATDESADLNAIAVDVGVFLAPMALARSRMIEVIEAEPAPIVHGSAEAIFNALRNLVENALTQAPEDSTVTVRVAAPATLSVRDHGPGVPEEWRERIFQRFWRAERRKSGAGLGLAIVRSTMDAHGGTVTVEDAPGGGALFSLRFPAQR